MKKFNVFFWDQFSFQISFGAEGGKKAQRVKKKKKGRQERNPIEEIAFPNLDDSGQHMFNLKFIHSNDIKVKTAGYC